jgi:hypothetical protein
MQPLFLEIVLAGFLHVYGRRAETSALAFATK